MVEASRAPQVPLSPSELPEKIKALVANELHARRQPSAWELLKIIEDTLGWKSRWLVWQCLMELAKDPTLTLPMKDYVAHLAESEDLDSALRGVGAPKKDILSTIDTLFRQSSAYRKSSAFQEMVSFMANFRDYAPYNNMLVRLQNPSCSFYASETDWKRRFARHIKEDAHPMLILAPMHPVMLVYELDQTEGPPLPKELERFAHFEGEWNPRWIQQTVRNAAIHDRVRVDFKHLSSTNAGFATLARGTEKWKMRIAVHDGLDRPSRYGVMVHELAHIYLGHLGSDKDHWWPSRSELDAKAIEIEAEAVAFIVTTRFGLKGESAAYVSGHLTTDGLLPTSVSVDLVAKVASRIEAMARTALRKRAPSKPSQNKMHCRPPAMRLFDLL